MSIYPVKITKWYDDTKNPFYDQRDILKSILPHSKCEQCAGSMKGKWSTGYVMHSITFGGPNETWCTKRCLLGKPKKKEEFPHYYICDSCAKSKGGKWPKGHCATSHMDICKYCNETKGLVATSDWLWGKEKTLKVWD